MRSDHVLHGVGDPTTGGLEQLENDVEKRWRELQGGNKSAPSTGGGTVDLRQDAFHRAQRDMWAATHGNRNDLYGDIVSSFTKTHSFLSDLAETTKVKDIWTSFMEHGSQILAAHGLAFEAEMFSSFFQGLMGVGMEEKHERPSDDAGWIRRNIIGPYCSMTGLRWTTPMQDMDAGEVFDKALQGNAASCTNFWNTSLPSAMEKHEPGGREKCTKMLEDYGQQLGKQLQQYYPNLSSNQIKSLVKQLGEDIGQFIADNGVTVVKNQPENPQHPNGVYLNNYTDPAGKPLMLSEPGDMAMFITMMVSTPERQFSLDVYQDKSQARSAADITVPPSELGGDGKDKGPDSPTPPGGPGTDIPVAIPNGPAVDIPIAVPGDPAAQKKDPDGPTTTNGPTTTGGPDDGKGQGDDAGAKKKPAPTVGGLDEIELMAPSSEQSRPMDMKQIANILSEAGISERDFMHRFGTEPVGPHTPTPDRPAGGDPLNPSDKPVSATFLENLPDDVGKKLVASAMSADKEENMGTWVTRMSAAQEMPSILNNLQLDDAAVKQVLGDGNFKEADGSYGPTLQAHLKAHPEKVDALSERVAEEILSRIPENSRSEMLGIKPDTVLETMRFENGEVVATTMKEPLSKEDLKEWLQQNPEAMQQASAEIGKARNQEQEVALSEEKRTTITNLLEQVDMSPAELKALLFPPERAADIDLKDKGDPQVAERLSEMSSTELRAVEQKLQEVLANQQGQPDAQDITGDKGRGSVVTPDGTTTVLTENAPPVVPGAEAPREERREERKEGEDKGDRKEGTATVADGEGKKRDDLPPEPPPQAIPVVTETARGAEENARGQAEELRKEVVVADIDHDKKAATQQREDPKQPSPTVASEMGGVVLEVEDIKAAMRQEASGVDPDAAAPATKTTGKNTSRGK